MGFLSSIGVFLWFSETFFHRFLYGVILVIVFSVCSAINEKRPDMNNPQDKGAASIVGYYFVIAFTVGYLITLFIKQGISYWILIAYTMIAIIYALCRKFAPVSMKKVEKRVKRHIKDGTYLSLIDIVKFDNQEINKIVIDSIAKLDSKKAVEILKETRFEEVSKESKDFFSDKLIAIINSAVDSNAFEDIEYLLDPNEKEGIRFEWKLLIDILLEKHKDKTVELFMKYGSDKNTLLYKKLEEILVGSHNDAIIDALLTAITNSLTSNSMVSNIQNIISKSDKDHVRKALLSYLKKDSGAKDINSNVLSVIKDLKDKTDIETVTPMLEFLNEKALKEILLTPQGDASIDALLTVIIKNTFPATVASHIKSIISQCDKEYVQHALVRTFDKRFGTSSVEEVMLNIVRELMERTDMPTVLPILKRLNDSDVFRVLNEYQQVPTTSDMFEYRAYDDGANDGLMIVKYTGEPKNIVIPSNYNGKKVSAIAAGVFEEKNIISLVIAPTIKFIGVEAFYGNKLEAVFIPDSVEVIGIDAFKNNSLTYVRLSKNLKNLGVEAFCRNKMHRTQAPQSILIDNGKMKFMLMQAFDPGLKIDIIPD